MPSQTDTYWVLNVKFPWTKNVKEAKSKKTTQQDPSLFGAFMECIKANFVYIKDPIYASLWARTDKRMDRGNTICPFHHSLYDGGIKNINKCCLVGLKFYSPVNTIKVMQSCSVVPRPRHCTISAIFAAMYC